MSREESTEDIKKLLTTKRATPLPARDLLSTGSTLLNLACSGKPTGGLAKGKYYLLVGASGAGKTWLSLNIFAEAAHNERFKDYQLIHDIPEGGAMMDIAAYFGQSTADRIRPPAVDESGEPRYSQTVEEFYYNLDTAYKAGKPFIYVLDSMDCIPSKEDVEKFDENKKTHEKSLRTGKEYETAGTYGVAKAKANSVNLRVNVPRLAETGSILIIISQVRANLAPMAMEKETRAGGHALKFYATLELWLKIQEKLRRTVRGKQRSYGVMTRVDVKKNRVSGRDRRVTFPILYTHGIDDVGSCVQYLIEEGHWKKNGSLVKAHDLDYNGSEEQVIRHIEEKGLEREVQGVVAKVWQEIEEATAVQRKPRYE